MSLLCVLGALCGQEGFTAKAAEIAKTTGLV
jgi:hypothetical protein